MSIDILTVMYVLLQWLMYDTQALMKDKKRHFAAEDYVAACIELYFDIVQIFQYLLFAFGGVDKS